MRTSVTPSKIAVAAALLLGCSGEATPRTVTPWYKQFGVSGVQTIKSLGVGETGELLLTGSFNREIDLGGSLVSAGSNDIFVAMLDNQGEALWSGRTGSGGTQEGQGIAFAPNGDVLATGNFTGMISFGAGKLQSTAASVFLIRQSPSGELVWSKQFGDLGSSVTVAGLAALPDGSVLIAGSFFQEVSFGGAPLTALGQSAYVAKLDAKGRHVYSVGFGGSGNQVTAVAVDALGAALVAGNNNNTIQLGEHSFTTTGSSVFVAKLSPEGAPGWLTQFGDVGGGNARSIAADAEDNLLVSGDFNSAISFGGKNVSSSGYRDAFVAKLSGVGQPLWFQSFGKADSGTNAFAVVASNEGHAIATGMASGSVDFGGGLVGSDEGLHAFLLELSAEGAHVASESFDRPPSGFGSSSGAVLALDPAGGVVVGGTFSGEMVVGAVTLRAKSDRDLFLVRKKR